MNNLNESPGPGNYYIKKQPQNNIGSFSRAERVVKNKNGSFPGPSDYNVKIQEVHPSPDVGFIR